MYVCAYKFSRDVIFVISVVNLATVKFSSLKFCLCQDMLHLTLANNYGKFQTY